MRRGARAGAGPSGDSPGFVDGKLRLDPRVRGHQRHRQRGELVGRERAQPVERQRRAVGRVEHLGAAPLQQRQLGQPRPQRRQRVPGDKFGQPRAGVTRIDALAGGQASR